MCVRICQVLLPHGPEPVCVCLKDLLCSLAHALSVCVCVCAVACVCAGGGNSTFLIICHCQNESSECDRMDGAVKNSWAPFQRIRLGYIALGFSLDGDKNLLNISF